MWDIGRWEGHGMREERGKRENLVFDVYVFNRFSYLSGLKRSTDVPPCRQCSRLLCLGTKLRLNRQKFNHLRLNLRRGVHLQQWAQISRTHRNWERKIWSHAMHHLVPQLIWLYSQQVSHKFWLMLYKLKGSKQECSPRRMNRRSPPGHWLSCPSSYRRSFFVPYWWPAFLLEWSVLKLFVGVEWSMQDLHHSICVTL